MKILFVSSGNKKNGISTVVENQGKSLERNGVEIEYFPIEGKGLMGYGKNIRKLSRIIQKGKFDVIHAHYSLSGFLTTLASLFRANIVVSLMGTFRRGTLKYYLVRFLAVIRWKAVIVKSERMKSQIGIKNARVIPNGVWVDLFEQQSPREKLRKALGFEDENKYVLFASDPNRPEKNFKLCRDAIAMVNDNTVELCILFDLSHEKVVQYLLAADVLMLTSFTEGSPNIIKEAMAANCPIVTTNVGDVRNIIGNTDGCYIIDSFNVIESAEKLKLSLAFNERTKGRDRIYSLGLDDITIARQLIDIYA